MSKTNKNNTKSKLIPELRFPEFKDKPQWEVKELGEVVATKRGLAGKNANDFGSGSPFVTYKQVFDFSAIELSKCGKVRIDEGENQNELHKGDVLITISSETAKEAGFASVILDEPKEPTYLNSFCLALRPHSLEELHPNFARYVFQCSSFRDKATRIAQGITRYNITQTDLLQLPLPLPSLPEQEHIGEFFSVLDSLIQAQSKEVQLLRLRKKGLMQKLFPYEGETTPEWRFPEFKDAPEWEVKELGEVGSVAMCRRIFKHETIPYSEEAIPFYKIGTFGKKADAYIPADLYHDYKQRYPYPKKGDVLISASGTIGRLIIFDGKPAYFQDSNIVWIKHNESDVLNSYLLQALSIAKWQSSDGGVINRLYNSNLLQTTIPIPSLAEQERIGALFSTLDSLIEAKSQRLEQLKKHKKGLMQKMFT